MPTPVLKIVAWAAALFLIYWCFMSFQKGTEVEEVCGPSVSQPYVLQGVNKAQNAGRIFASLADGDVTRTDVIKTVLGTTKFFSLYWMAFRAEARGEDEPTAVTGWKFKSEKAMADALARCCPGFPATPEPPQGEAPGNEEWDPRNASLQQRRYTLRGAALAADAARSAGFPESQIRMAVAVAKLESGFRNVTGPTVGNGTMRGMWQINDGAHPEKFVGRDWRDPYDNAEMAYLIWREGRSWAPWTTASAARAALGDSAPPRAEKPNTLRPRCEPAVITEGQTRGAVPANFNQQGNPRTAEQAIAWLKAAMPNGAPGERVFNRCERYMNLAYGHNGGYPSANAHWNAPGPRKPGMSAPPRGALVFWQTGTYGHVAMSLGDGTVISTDYDPVSRGYKVGIIGIAPLSDIDRWGPRLGWRAPNFQQNSEAV